MNLINNRNRSRVHAAKGGTKTNTMYKIEQSHVIYKDGKINTIIVLWESCPGYSRATYANTKPVGGYEWLKPNEQLCDALLQRVAGYGMKCPEALCAVFLKSKKLRIEQ